MNGFLKRASAFVTAVFMMFGILTVFPEEWFSQISLLVSAEESNLYIIKTEQVCNNAQFTINSITMCAASEGLCKMNVTITKSEDVEWNDSEGLYIFIYGKKTNEENYVKIGGIASTSFGSSTLSFMVDGPDETSPLETYSEIYFDCGYGYGNSTTELKNSFVSCTRIYMSTSAPQEDEEITYKIYNGHNYTVFNNKATTWLEAEAYCESLGGHLATISDANENEAVYSIMRELGFESAYFGYSDHISQGTWKWVTDENITYTNWASGEPNNYPSLEYYGSREPYAMFYSKYTDAKWNSGDFGVYTDNGGKAFICEWDSGSSTEETDPIEIDVQLLDKDNNPIDTIEYKRGEINAYLKVSFSNKPISIINIKSNVLIMKDADNNESKLVCYDVGSNQNEIIIPIVGFSMYCDNEDHSSNIYCGQNITVNVECIYGEGEEDKACKNFSFPCKSDVFNVVNGEYDTDEVDYELLTNYFWQDTLLFKYIYYGKDLYLPGIKYNIKRSCSNGTCFGFSSVLSVLRNSNSVKKYFNLNNISDINAQTSYGELQFKQLIQIMQTSQFSVAIRKELNDKEHFNNLPNLVEAVKKIQPNDMEKMLIWVQSDNSAHLLTPYKINDMGELFEGQYEILVYDSNKPYYRNAIYVDVLNNRWGYEMGDDTWSNFSGDITFCYGEFDKYMDCILLKSGNKQLNVDGNGNVYAGLISSSGNINLENSDLIPFGLIANGNNQNSIPYQGGYVVPTEQTIKSNNSQSFSFTYCLTDTAISADLPANAEITLNVSDNNPDDTYATVLGSSGDSISLSLEHNHLIDRDFTDIKFDGVMYDTLKIQETDDGVTVSGLKSGSFEITATDGTVTNEKIDEVSDDASITTIVNGDNTSDVLLVDNSTSSLRKIYVNSEELSNFSYKENSYTVSLPYSTTTIPTVTATPMDEKATVAVTQAKSLKGTETERTATITVTAEDGVTQTIYKVIFSVEEHTHYALNEYSSDETGHWYACSECNEKIDFETHSFGKGVVVKKPTKTEAGERQYTCVKCGYVKSEILSTFESSVVIYNGNEEEYFENLSTAFKKYSKSTADLVVTINEDITEKTINIPSKASSVTFEGLGAINITSSSLTIPANTTFNTEVNGKGKILAVKVSAGKTLDINNKTSNIGAVSGTRTSTLNINEDTEVMSIATFGTVNVEDGKTLTVTSKLSAVTSLNGAVKLPTAKTTAATVTAGNAEIILTDGNIAKVTLADVTNKLNVKVVNENGETTDLSSGTIVLYSTKDISEKVTVENTTADQKELNAFYYKKNKAVKAEWADAVTLYNGETSRNFPNVELVLANITDKNTDYTITLNTDVAEPRFILPKTAKSITINGTGSLTTAVTNIAVPVDTTIGCEIKQSANKAIALRSAANTTLTLSAENSFGAVSGARTSKLNVNENAEITSIATFESVNVAENKTLTVTSKLSAVTSLNGTVKLPTAKTTAATVTAGNAEIILTNDDIAKVTLADVTTKLNVKVVDESNEAVKLASGTIVLYSTKDISEKTTIENITSDDKELNAFYYKKNKAIKAEWADAITLSYSDTGRKFPNMELALESITDRNTDYTITLNTDITASTFALPTLTKAQSVTIKSENEAKTITLTNIAAVSAKTPLTLENIKLESTKPYTISTTYDLTLDRFASDSITAVKGGTKATLTLGEITPIDKVSGFGTTKVTSEFRTGTMFTTTDLELTETANLVVSNTKAPATAKTLNGAEGSVITLDAGFTPIKVTGTTADCISGTIKLKVTEAIDENTVLFTTKYAGNNVFDVTEIQPQTELDYTVTSISGKAYMKPIVFEMNNTGYALWTDVMTVIENVKMSEAQYTVKLLDSTNINGALKLPKARTYGKLTIASDNKTLTFTGSITATGELEIANTNLDSARNNTSSKYTISAGKYPFTAENADLSLASITSTADVTLKNTRTSGTVRAGKLTLNGENTILGTITANELGSTEEGTVLNILSNTRGVMSITKNGIAENSEEITIKLVDESENAVTAENLSIIASSFTGNYNGELKLSTENGEFSIILSRNKLVLADSITAANGLLEADEEESDDTDTSEEEPAEETPDDNSDDAPSEEDPSEEDAPKDGDTSDNDINEETESSDMTEELSA